MIPLTIEPSIKAEKLRDSSECEGGGLRGYGADGPLRLMYVMGVGSLATNIFMLTIASPYRPHQPLSLAKSHACLAARVSHSHS